MANSKFIEFNAWLVTNKEYLGNRDALLENVNITDAKGFKKKIDELSDVYNSNYGVNNKVRVFFENYLDKESKKQLIRSIWFHHKDQDIFLYKCFVSQDQCLLATGKLNDTCQLNDTCKLNDEAYLNKNLKFVVNFINGYYRNNFVHAGKTGAIADENAHLCWVTYKEDTLRVKLSYKCLKDIVVKGIKEYFIRTKNEN